MGAKLEVLQTNDDTTVVSHGIWARFRGSGSYNVDEKEINANIAIYPEQQYTYKHTASAKSGDTEPNMAKCMLNA